MGKDWGRGRREQGREGDLLFTYSFVSFEFSYTTDMYYIFY